jgi:hypothetical protein
LQSLSFKTKNQENSSHIDDTGDNKKKRFRRPAEEIERHFKCPSETCQKKYGYSLYCHLKYSLRAEGSLN